MSDGIIYLTADFTAATGTQTTATVERSLSATGPWALLDSVTLLNQVGTYTDTTVPLDTPVWYRWSGFPAGTGSVIIQGPFTEASNGTVWVKDPLRPWANVEFSFCASPQAALNSICAPTGPAFIWQGWAEATRRVDATLSDIYNSETPADTWGRRKNRDSVIRFMTKTLAARDAVHALFTAGGPLQTQAPTVYGWEDVFVQPLDLVEEYLHPDQRRPYRLWTVPILIVRRPVGPVQGTLCANWCNVTSTWPTYGDLAASGSTWGELASGIAQCPTGTPVAPLIDTFTRTVANGWDTADTGQVWTTSGGTASDYSVNGSQGVHSHPVTGGTRNTFIPSLAPDVTVTSDFSLPFVPTGDSVYVTLLARASSVNNTYMARVQVAAGGAMTLTVRTRIGGVETQLASFATGLTYVANVAYTVRFRVDGTNLMAKIWLTSGTEPAGWQVSGSNGALTNTDQAGYRTIVGSTLTNTLPIVFNLDNFKVTV